jgi:hypothetical protein
MVHIGTITIDGLTGSDTVDITWLTSDHRVVFVSNGGDDTVVGTPRPEDVFGMSDGISALSDMTCGPSDFATGGVRAEDAGRGQWHERGQLAVLDARAGRTMVDAIDDLVSPDLVEHNGLAGPAHEVVTRDLTNLDTQGILIQACGFPI